MSQTLLRPSPALFMPQKQPAKPMTRQLKVGVRIPAGR